ncbi:hypothetical protein N836_09490 [Leptolyngbya sp. Heron Island J]|uniref:hypothetical protein n=1 Tax=Leptolyngbya sp. Heron Island J TaxID=1385935 RepID=UPI0003B968D0|nr:hypothetical protein [Leptolyngbya sp. Heron Island J]ESA35942.1 hypothetical protein N836_09490 [Leptolyngbya sp. Heron Island J]
MADKFQPSPSDLPDLSEYDPLTEPDWDEVRSLAEEQDWEWNEDKGAYVDDDDDEIVPLSTILELTYEELERIQGEISTAVEKLEDDEDVAEWERRIAEIAAAAAALFFLLGMGARGNINDDHSGHVRDRLTVQFEYLRQFSEDILDGNLTINRIKARANLYPQDDQLLYSEAQEFIHSTEEWSYVRNLLGGCQHCRDCLNEAAKGWVERDQMSMPGTRMCRWNCCCMLEYAKEKPGQNSNQLTILTLGAGWLVTLPTTTKITKGLTI